MQATCVQCGTEFEAQRRTARYCTAACSQRATRRRAAERASGGAQPVAAPASPPPPAADMPLLVAATLEELRQAGRLGTALGQAALVLAEKAGSRNDTGSATAAVVRQLQATLAAALEGTATVQDPVDELRKRRDSKRAG